MVARHDVCDHNPYLLKGWQMMVTINLYSIKRYSQKSIISLFGESPDRILTYRTGKELYTYFFNRTGTWVIELDNIIVGLFSLQYKDNKYFTATYIFPEYRGKGINTPLKRAALSTARSYHEEIVSLIRQNNERSIKATLKAFPQTIMFSYKDTDGEMKLLCDYSMQTVILTEGICMNVGKVLGSFFRKQANQRINQCPLLSSEPSTIVLNYDSHVQSL